LSLPLGPQTGDSVSQVTGWATRGPASVRVLEPWAGAPGPTVYAGPMFGHDWEPGTATIVAVHVKSTTGDGLVSIHEFAADITPASGAPFRTLLEEPTIATDFWAPGVGDVVKVQVDVKREKAKFDKADPKISFKAHQHGDDARFEATLAAAPAAAVPTASASIPDRAADVAAQIERLKALRAGGVLTDDEYQAQARKLIAGL
jgi:hypothetical protein